MRYILQTYLFMHEIFTRYFTSPCFDISTIDLGVQLATKLEYTLLMRDWGTEGLSFSGPNAVSVHIDPDALPLVSYFMSKSSPWNFKLLTDITLIDSPQYLNRFVLEYVFRDLDSGLVFKLQTTTGPFRPISSISSFHFSALSAEREIVDMGGVRVADHREYRRIIGDYSFWGFPLRKDFPMGGHFEYFFFLSLYRVFRLKGNFNNFWNINFQTWKSFNQKIHTPRALDSWLSWSYRADCADTYEIFKWNFGNSTLGCTNLSTN